MHSIGTVSAAALRAGLVVAGTIGALGSAQSAAAQSGGDQSAAVSGSPFDHGTLTVDRPAMRALLEKTIFKVDVAWLDLWLTPSASEHLSALAGRDVKALDDSIAGVVLATTDAMARLRFERDVGLDRFLDGLVSNARKAQDAGIISTDTYDEIVAASPRWYAPLRERGIRDQDEMWYRIRGDTLRTYFRTADGRTLIDQTDIGPERRLAVLGGYLAPGSDFRERLIDSVRSR